MLGQVITYRGRAWRVIEYLQDRDTWVIQVESGESMIQPDQYGDARRRVPETRLITAESDPKLHAWIGSNQSLNKD